MKQVKGRTVAYLVWFHEEVSQACGIMELDVMDVVGRQRDLVDFEICCRRTGHGTKNFWAPMQNLIDIVDSDCLIPALRRGKEHYDQLDTVRAGELPGLN